MITVTSPLPQTGKSVIAANLAFEIGKTSKVCLVDADFAQPCQHLLYSIPNAPASLPALCRLISQDRLAESDFESLTMELVVPGSKVTLIAGNPNSSSVRDLNFQSFETLLELLCMKFDEVVIDLGTPQACSREFEDLVLRRSENIITTGNSDQVSLSRFISKLEDFSQQVDFEKTTLVMNQLRDTVLGSNARFQLTDTLAKHTPFNRPIFMPWDQNFDTAMLKAVPLAFTGKKSSALLAIQELSASLTSKVAKTSLR